MDISRPINSFDWEQTIRILVESFAKEYQKTFLLPAKLLKNLIYELNKDSDLWNAKQHDSVIGVLNLSHPRHNTMGFIKKGKLVRENVPFVPMHHSAFSLFNPKMRFKNSLSIDQLAVDKALRGKGIGSKLLDFSKNYADSLGLGFLSLMVDLDNPAVSFYQRKGFIIKKTISRWPIPQTLGYRGVYIMVCKV